MRIPFRMGDLTAASHPPAQQAEPCQLCGADEAFTGSCGGGRNNPKALCFSPPPHKAEGAEPHAVAIYSVHSNKPYRVKPYEGPDSLSDDGGLGEHWGGTEPLYPTTQEPSA